MKDESKARGIRAGGRGFQIERSPKGRECGDLERVKTQNV